MGRRKKGRDVDGVLLLDKPLGCSSNAALQRARRLFDARKAGHTGSLDPLATGLLPVCFGEATKLSSWLLQADKCYRVSADLRFATDTGDREGQPIRYPEVQAPAADELVDILSHFVGEQKQVPPMYSALKRDGKPLYELARAGIEVQREARAIVVHDIQLLHHGDDAMTLDVAVSSGTYVRTLVEDIARSWGGAAHVSALRRTRVGAYAADSMQSFEQLETIAATGQAQLDAVLVSASQALAHWPRVTLTAADEVAVSHGQALTTATTGSGWVCIMNGDGGFLGLGEIDAAGCLQPRRMFTRTLR